MLSIPPEVMSMDLTLADGKMAYQPPSIAIQPFVK